MGAYRPEHDRGPLPNARSRAEVHRTLQGWALLILNVLIGLRVFEVI